MPLIDFTPVTITDLLKLLGAVLVFGLGLYQYAKAQKWKRREFIAAQMKDFEADRKIQLTMTMLDWNDREVLLPYENPRLKDKATVKITDELLCTALLPGSGYDDDETSIRDCFDRFLDMLVRLDNFVESGLISDRELRPYIEYWLQLVSGSKRGWHSPEFFALLLNHIRAYGFDGAASLIKRFGCPSEPTKEALDAAIAKTNKRRSRYVFSTESLLTPTSGEGTSGSPDSTR